MDFEKKTKIKKTMVVLSNTFWSEIISSIRFIMTIGMFLVKEFVNALGGGGVFFSSAQMKKFIAKKKNHKGPHHPETQHLMHKVRQSLE